MDHNTVKPRLLFFRFTRPGLPAFIRLHLEEQVKCLSLSFDVTVIDGPADYGRLCDQYRPDLALFESGTYVGRRQITNISAHPDIPKVGFCHCDAYCQTREVFIADMAKWGIETFFSSSISLPSYTPSLADNLFVWPNFVDPTLYRDYGLPKIIPVLFTGSQAPHYPWRNRINAIISQYYPSLQCPHHGWFDQGATSGMISGEPYARMINTAWIAPACGTIANEVVRKHFEIPACRTCLVTQRTSALEAAGFSDLVNCVFANDAEVLEKLEWLFRHRDELEKIASAGYDLVHSQHTIRQRDQVFQWFSLNKQVKPHQKVVQLGPFLPMTIVDRSSRIKNGHINSGGLDRILLSQADESLWSGQYHHAETLYRRCLNYHHMPEAQLRLALCCLYKGNADLAIHLISELLQGAHLLDSVKAAEPDPVEWAYYIVALLCRGKLREAAARAEQFEMLSHPELQRVREAIGIVSDQVRDSMGCDSRPFYRYSVHQLPDRKMEAWLDELRTMLQASGQRDLAKRLPQSSVTWKIATGMEGRNGSSPQSATSWRSLISSGGGKTPLAAGRSVYGVKLAGYPARVKFWIRKAFQTLFLRPTRKLAQKIRTATGLFLPYDWSAVRHEEGVLAIRRLLRESDIKSGLLIGAAAGEKNTKAFLAGMSENRNKPVAVCMNFMTPRFVRLQRRLSRNSSIECRAMPDGCTRHEDHIRSFDAVVIDGSEIAGEISGQETHGAGLIVLDDINKVQTYNLYHGLLADRNYTLLGHNPSHRGGYAIFRSVIGSQSLTEHVDREPGGSRQRQALSAPGQA